MNRPEKNDPLWQLMDAAISGTLTEAEAATLNERLRGDRQAQSIFLEYVQLHAELSNVSRRLPLMDQVLECMDVGEESAPKVELAEGPQIGKRPTTALDKFQDIIDWRRRKLRFGTFALAVTVLLWAGIILALQPWKQNQVVNDAVPQEPTVVAEVVQLDDVRWADPETAVFEKAKLVSGQPLQLTTGLVKIAHSDGTEVVLEGPISYVVEDRGKGNLKLGRMTALVPPAAVGFTIQTPTALIEDLGTQFGVVVEDDGATTVHVQTGMVEVQPNAKSAKPIVIRQGDAIVVDAAGNAAKLVAGQAEEFKWDTPQPGEKVPAVVSFDGQVLDETQWVDKGWGKDGYVFFGIDLPANEEGKTLGVMGVQKRGAFFSGPTAVPEEISQIMTLHGDYAGSGNPQFATAAVALQDASGRGTFRPGALYRRRTEADGIQGVFQVRFTQDVPKLRVTVLLDNQWVSQENSVPPKLQLRLLRPGANANSPVVTPDPSAESPQADWYHFTISNIAAGDELVVGGERVDPDGRRYVAVGGVVFQTPASAE